MNFKKTNNLAGWAVALIACTVYVLTTEANGSFWDCGEFVSSSFKLQIPHPPGAPLFVMLGRLFIILFGNNPLTAAKAVNVMSALASGFTILFLFWTITHFARRIAKVGVNDSMTTAQMWSIMGAGVVGALAYTFTDSFWYSAVEGEVYAMSSFFSAIVFWAILKWDNVADEPGADRWLVLIFFLIGLSIGVHLLCLLNIPAVVMVYYFRRREQFNFKAIRKWFLILVIAGGFLAFIAALIVASADASDNVPADNTVAALMIVGTLAAIGILYLIEKIYKEKKEYYTGIYIFFLIGCILTGVVQIFVIQYSIKYAGVFDRIFVDNLGLPFFSGFTFFFIVLAGLIWWGLKYAQKKNWAYLRLALWCFSFVLLGYGTYLTTMIRSNANPAIDMYNVDNPLSLVGYLGRDQYGDFPLLYGQKFTASPVDYKEGAMKYQKGKDKYVAIGRDGHYVYMPDDKMVFPRVWDASNDQYHADYYASFLGIQKYRDKNGQVQYDRTPNQADNFRFLVQYQFYWMYFRYFAWNFIGKQDDVQGVFIGNVRDGNWITGISFIDNLIYGNQSLLPDSIKNSKGHNTLFAFPFILGLIGLFYHFKKRGDDAISNFLLFFFTGIAIIIYLNQAGNQPRERDYAYVGSFYAFAVWIGLGVMKVIEWFSKKLPQSTAAILATLLCLVAVPTVMAQQEWDDHDRSRKTLARDLAKDYLESCAPNAILFTFGDNDTYPLWYAQEVEGIRKDIRVINYSLLGIDWYINELRYKINTSDPIDVIYTADQIEGRKRDYIVYQPKPNIPQDRYYDLYDLMKNYVGSNDPDKMADRGGGDVINTFPVRKVSVPVDTALVRKNGTVGPNDTIVSELRFEIPRGTLMKNDIAMLNIIAANKWKRPIYFTGYFSDLGFQKYLRKDGLSYRLVPVENQYINSDTMANNLLRKFAFGGADVKNVYFDEENRRHLLTIRQAYAELASDLADKGRKAEAREVLEKADKGMLQENFPYGMVSRANYHDRISLQFLDACYRSGDTTLAAKVSASVKKDLEQQIRYYNGLSGNNAENMADDKQTAESYLKALEQLKEMYYPKLPVLENGKLPGMDSGKLTKPLPKNK
ncbi:DUF2723 domain-containing protein [Hydrotalea sp.]|uniref:glycosyltransferase family 117 protein n=1 Tax=Hydrotalea sp. TaxID=2881279 RepID=UPI002604D2AE|nr:DUF2723 domain-containing protein [Hydrotalea sp.]